MQDTIGFWHSLQPSHAYSPVPSRLWVAIHWGNLPLPYHKVLYIYNLDHPSASFRKDSRHNFSVYFYMLYLTVGDDDIGLNVLTFLPQVVLLLLLTYKYSSIYEVNFCIFCQTLVFVTFNKVRLVAYSLQCMTKGVNLTLSNFKGCHCTIFPVVPFSAATDSPILAFLCKAAPTWSTPVGFCTGQAHINISPDFWNIALLGFLASSCLSAGIQGKQHIPVYLAWESCLFLCKRYNPREVDQEAEGGQGENKSSVWPAQDWLMCPSTVLDWRRFISF